MVRVASILVFSILAACTAPGDEPADDDAVCEAAAEHMESCLPGIVAARPETCEGTDQERSKWVLEQSCSELLASAGDGKADGVPALQGVRIRKVGNRTYFSIPLGATFGGDRERLLQESINKFTGKMAELNQAMIERGINLSSLLTGANATEFAHNYASTIDALAADDVANGIEVELGTKVAEPRKLASWRRYVIPQAFMGYISTKFTVDWGVSAGISLTVITVVQPWLTLAVDHTLPQPVIVDKLYEVDAALLGVPNVDVGLGIGASIPLRIGVGAVFGPIDQPDDLEGWGLGLSGGITLPVIGGTHGQFISVLKYPPLFMLLLGYSTGTGAEVEVHGNLQRVLDLDGMLKWIASLPK